MNRSRRSRARSTSLVRSERRSRSWRIPAMHDRDVEPPRAVVVPQVVVQVGDPDRGTDGAQPASQAQELPQPHDNAQHLGIRLLGRPRQTAWLLRVLF